MNALEALHHNFIAGPLLASTCSEGYRMLNMNPCENLTGGMLLHEKPNGAENPQGYGYPSLSKEEQSYDAVHS